MTTPALLNAERLRARLVEEGPFAALDVVTVTGSTNSDLVEAAGRGAADRTVLLAEEQEAGRGRRHRPWVSPRAYGLHVSVLFRHIEVPPVALPWLPLIAGVALAETVHGATGLLAALKWPNDLLLQSGNEWFKAAGVLAEGISTPGGMAVVLGIGLNVHHSADDLPRGAGGLPATSLAAQGAEVDREELAIALLTDLAEVDHLWRDHDGDVVSSGLLKRYHDLCATLGQQVQVELGDSVLRGTALEIDANGRLLVCGADGDSTAVSAGDVVHLRPA